MAKEKNIKIKEVDSFGEHIGYFTIIFNVLLTVIHPAPFLLNLKLTWLDESYYYSDGVFITFNRPVHEYCIIIQVIYSLLNVLMIFMETRRYMTHRTQRIAKMGNHEIGFDFHLKYFMKKYELYSPLLLLFFGAIFFGSILRISEVGSWNYVLDNPAIFPDAAAQDEAKGEFQVMHSYINLLWFVFITITTVGYGDIYPKATLSRIFMYAFGLWGMISLSMTIATFMNILDLDEDEKRFLKLMDYFRIIKRVRAALTQEKEGRQLRDRLLRQKRLRGAQRGPQEAARVLLQNEGGAARNALAGKGVPVPHSAEHFRAEVDHVHQ